MSPELDRTRDHRDESRLLWRLVVSLSKQRFCQHGCHPKIGISNIGGILHHSAHVRKQKIIKILCFVICAEDYHKLIQTQFLIQSPSASDVRGWQKRRLLKLSNINSRTHPKLHPCNISIVIIKRHCGFVIVEDITIAIEVRWCYMILWRNILIPDHYILQMYIYII
jgi:hypothetical protein